LADGEYRGAGGSSGPVRSDAGLARCGGLVALARLSLGPGEREEGGMVRESRDPRKAGRVLGVRAGLLYTPRVFHGPQDRAVGDAAALQGWPAAGARGSREKKARPAAPRLTKFSRIHAAPSAGLSVSSSLFAKRIFASGTRARNPTRDKQPKSAHASASFT
jgi:hypothetical protein